MSIVNYYLPFSVSELKQQQAHQHPEFHAKDLSEAIGNTDEAKDYGPDEEGCYARSSALSEILADKTTDHSYLRNISSSLKDNRYLNDNSIDGDKYVFTAHSSSGRNKQYAGVLLGRVVDRYNLETCEKEKVFEVVQLSVHPKYRRKGYGTELMKAALEKAHQLGLKSITASVIQPESKTSNLPWYKFFKSFQRFTTCAEAVEKGVKPQIDTPSIFFWAKARNNENSETIEHFFYEAPSFEVSEVNLENSPSKGEISLLLRQPVTGLVEAGTSSYCQPIYKELEESHKYPREAIFGLADGQYIKDDALPGDKYIFVARQRQTHEIVGFLYTQVEPIFADTFNRYKDDQEHKVHNVVYLNVHPNFQNMGIGQELMKAALKKTQELGIEYLDVHMVGQHKSRKKDSPMSNPYRWVSSTVQAPWFKFLESLKPFVKEFKEKFTNLAGKQFVHIAYKIDSVSKLFGKESPVFQKLPKKRALDGSDEAGECEESTPFQEPQRKRPLDGFDEAGECEEGSIQTDIASDLSNPLSKDELIASKMGLDLNTKTIHLYMYSDQCDGIDLSDVDFSDEASVNRKYKEVLEHVL